MIYNYIRNSCECPQTHRQAGNICVLANDYDQVQKYIQHNQASTITYYDLIGGQDPVTQSSDVFGQLYAASAAGCKLK